MLKSMVCDFEAKNHRKDLLEVNKVIMNDVINNPKKYSYAELAEKYNRKYSQVTNLISQRGLVDKIRKATMRSSDVLEVNKEIVNDVINNPKKYTYSELAKKYNRTYIQIKNLINNKGLTDKTRKADTSCKSGKITSQVKNELFAFLNNK
jgi:plasmid maintenance system antidote protein VapI